jgi:hypothetical protein
VRLGRAGELHRAAQHNVSRRELPTPMRNQGELAPRGIGTRDAAVTKNIHVYAFILHVDSMLV